MFRRGRHHGGGVRRKGRRLGVEWLESRELLAGLVDVTQVGTTLFFTPVGNSSDNLIQVRQLALNDQFEVKGLVGTTLQINGAGNPVNVQTFTGVQNLDVRLGAGGDTFNFIDRSDGSRSVLAGSLYVRDEGGVDKTLLDGVEIRGTNGAGGVVAERYVSDGKSEMSIVDSIIEQGVLLDYDSQGFTGDTYTLIRNSELRRGLQIDSAVGENILDVQGVKIGEANNGLTAITFGDGGSRITFTTWEGTGTTLFGALNISTGDNPIGVGNPADATDPANAGNTSVFSFDTVTFNGTTVRQAVTINSNTGVGALGGDTQVIIGNVASSSLGSSVNLGGPLTVTNGPGWDRFEMINSSAPWGVNITNGTALENNGSQTTIRNSDIGTRIGAGLGLTLFGDGGADTVTIANSIVGETGVQLTLFDGPNTVTLAPDAGVARRQTFTQLVIIGGANSDIVTIQQTDVAINTDIELDGAIPAAVGGTDTLDIDYLVGAGVTPSTFTGNFLADGGLFNVGNDTIRRSSGVVISGGGLTISNFEIELFSA